MLLAIHNTTGAEEALCLLALCMLKLGGLFAANILPGKVPYIPCVLRPGANDLGPPGWRIYASGGSISLQAFVRNVVCEPEDWSAMPC